MPTECTSTPMVFARVDGRAVVADFDGGVLTSDAGALPLDATDDPLHCQKEGRLFHGYHGLILPRTSRASRRITRFPFFRDDSRQGRDQNDRRKPIDMPWLAASPPSPAAPAPPTPIRAPRLGSSGPVASWPE